MAVIHENLSFTILVMAAMSLLTFSITTQNTSATTSETRMLADLNPTNGAIADGRADYRERGNSVRLNVEVEDVSPNTTFTVEISGNTLGTITTSSFGTAELELNTNDGQVVPKILRGDLVQIFQGTELVLSGSFDGDGNIENGGQATITPNQNSVMQAGNSSSNLFTVPSGNATTTASIPVVDTPFYSEHITVTSQNPINASHLQASLSGSGNLTLPNSTETIAVNSTGSALVNFETTSAIVHEFLTTTEDEASENASATIYEITRHDVNARTEKGVVIAIFETNSTGQFAFLDGMIAVGQADVDAVGNTDITLWEFETGIPRVKNWMEVLMMSSQE